MPVTTRTATCIRRLSLLHRWLNLSEDYARAVLASKNSKSEVHRELVLMALEDAKTQMDAAREEFEFHRMTHGC